MRLLLLHLSDIHLHGKDDPVLARAPQVVDAVKNLDYEIDRAVVVISGDIAYSGADDQYMAAWEFVEKVTSLLAAGLRHPANGDHVVVSTVIVPGNHDCHFESTDEVRKILSEGVLKEPAKAQDPKLVGICTQVQDPFFQFREVAGSVGLTETGKDFGRRLFYEHVFEHKGEKVQFLCCNTAWLSRLEEVQGTLVFPSALLPDPPNGAMLSVAVLHHPYNWLEATQGRELRKRLEGCADLILTGHEHDATHRVQSGWAGERNAYIEGGALQDSCESTKSAFNAFIVDTKNRKQKFIPMSWDGQQYSQVGARPGVPDTQDSGWEDFQVNRLRQRGQFELREEMQKRLNDPGVALTQREHGTLSLTDIFVYPDLREVVFPIDKTPDVIRGDQVPDLVSRTRHMLILGDDQAGKSTLAKTLLKHLHDSGEVPILLSGTDAPPRGERLYPFLEELFTRQYEVEALGPFKHLDRSRRAIIVDDYEKLAIHPKDRRAFVEGLCKFAGRVILFAHELALTIKDLANPAGWTDGGDRFAQYRIQPFGHLRRNRLIEKWLLLADTKSADSTTFAHALDRVTRTLDTVIGKNFVPAYPVYVLAVLQASEANAPVDLRASTHGYFYELLIRCALARGKDRVEFDVAASYLSFLSYRMFRARSPMVSRRTLEEIHGDFQTRYDLKRDFDRMVEQLCRQGVLSSTGDQCQFKYRYVYYYFVANYMRDHIGDEEVLAELGKLTAALYVEEYSNILLFLAHLCKDPVVLTRMLEAAAAQFPECAPAELENDVAFLGEVEMLRASLEYEDRDPAETRKAILESQDKEEEEAVAQDAGREAIDTADGPGVVIDPLRRLNAALKTLQILGQILKNFPGSLEGPTKTVIARSCYDIGLRTMSAVFRLIRENQSGLVNLIAESIHKDHPGLRHEEVEKRAKGTVVGMTLMIAFGLVKRVSNAVGSADLEPTYARLLAERPTAAVNVIDASIALDHAGVFPDGRMADAHKALYGNQVALSVLQCLVIMHLSLFPVGYQSKQRVCELLGISLRKVTIVDPGRKLLGGGNKPPGS